MNSIYSLTAGLPDHLLTPTDEGTAGAAGGDESTLLMERRRLMRLDLDRLDEGQPGGEDQQQQRSGIVFSPGGSEAYVFTAGAAPAAAAAEDGGAMAAGSTPREIHDPIFVEGDREFAAANQRTRELIHERLGHIKTALGGGMQSEEPSPRNFAEHEFAASTTDDGSSLVSPRPGGTLQHPGRASSPSVASVASSTASGLTTGRKNLEWDSGADLGYLGDLHAQEDAAATLSTLEKMAIGNYTSFLRSPERGGARSKGGGNPTKQDLEAMHRRLRERQQTEDDMRQERLQKFADSLMKQRNLRKMTATKQAGVVSSTPGQQQKRSKSRESKKSTPDSSPSRRSERSSRRRSKSGSAAAVKSHSLTDLKDAATAAAAEGGGAAALRAYVSNSELAHAQLLPDCRARQAQGSALLQRILAGSSEPSSVSSAATVVATADAAVGVDDHLRSIGTDPQSIPQQLQVRRLR